VLGGDVWNEFYLKSLFKFKSITKEELL
jgi:hypothetical protein